MKRITGYRLVSALCFVLGAVCLVLILSGCAPMTEQYWSERYEEMTAEEIEAARDSDASINDIWLGAQTASRLVCINGECVVVQIY